MISAVILVLSASWPVSPRAYKLSSSLAATRLATTRFQRSAGLWPDWPLDPPRSAATVVWLVPSSVESRGPTAPDRLSLSVADAGIEVCMALRR